MTIGYTVFADESAVRERFLCYGAVFLPTGLVEEAEKCLAEFCSRRGFGDREMSWKKCSSAEVDRYSEFAQLLWEINDRCCVCDFRALVVDTKQNPLRGGAFRCTSDEDGFYKFYHFFITRSLAIVAKDATEFDLVVGAADDQYPFRDEILDKTISGSLRKLLAQEITVREVQRAHPNQARLHQLADVLLGAVSYRFNRFERSKPKTGVCDTIESRLDKALTDDFRPGERPFNVWAFAGKGKSRWTEGARGSV
jgi:hypothetical protein